MADPRTQSVAEAVVSYNDLLVARGYEELLRSNRLETFDDLFAISDAESLTKPGLSPWRERLRLTLDMKGTAGTFYLKRFTDPPAAVRRQVRRSACNARSVAGLEWIWMHRLASDGIPCVRPVAFGEEVRGLRERRSAILTAAAPGDSLERWAGRWTDADRETVRRLIPLSAGLVARLHERGYVHRDLYLSHVFFDPEAQIEDSLHLIDLQRVIRPRWGWRRWIVKELASLNFSAPPNLVTEADRVRWLKRYLDLPKLDISAKRLAYRVIGKTLRIARHDHRRRAGLEV